MLCIADLLFTLLVGSYLLFSLPFLNCLPLSAHISTVSSYSFLIVCGSTISTPAAVYLSYTICDLLCSTLLCLPSVICSLLCLPAAICYLFCLSAVVCSLFCRSENINSLFCLLSAICSLFYLLSSLYSATVCDYVIYIILPTCSYLLFILLASGYLFFIPCLSAVVCLPACCHLLFISLVCSYQRLILPISLSAGICSLF
jgi:hypothetical protein